MKCFTYYLFNVFAHFKSPAFQSLQWNLSCSLAKPIEFDLTKLSNESSSNMITWHARFDGKADDGLFAENDLNFSCFSLKHSRTVDIP